MYNLTAIYWIKNETRYLPEWIEFHLIQGFDHFIFYDNESNDGLYDVMQPYIEEGIVEIRKYPKILHPPAKSGPPNSKNFWVMDYCIEEQIGKSRWIHFHAVDEFTFMKDGSKVSDFLKNFESIGALSIEWEYFNSNGHVKRPEGLMIENYTEACLDPKHHVKTIIRPDMAYSTAGNPHTFIMKNGMSPVNEKGNLVNGPLSNDHNFEKIKNHHYVTRSKEEFEEKNSKGVLDWQESENEHRSFIWGEAGLRDLWQSTNYELDRYKCDDLLIYVNPVREAIAKRYCGKEYLLKNVCS